MNALPLSSQRLRSHLIYVHWLCSLISVIPGEQSQQIDLRALCGRVGLVILNHLYMNQAEWADTGLTTRPCCHDTARTANSHCAYGRCDMYQIDVELPQE